MKPQNVLAPASAATLTRGRNGEQLRRRLGSPNITRSARRQRLVQHLHRCGPRPVLEALIAVECGQDLDVVLEDFARLQPEIFEAVGADVLPIDDMAVVDGGVR